MDTRRLVIAMTLSLAVMWGYQYYLAKHQPPPQAAATQTTAAQPAEQPPTGTQSTAPASGQAVATASQNSPWHVRGAESAEQIVLGQDVAGTDPDSFQAQAFLTNRGAAVEQVLLVAKEKRGKKIAYKYARTVEGREPYPLLEPLATPSGRIAYSWETDSIRILPSEAKVSLRDALWNHEVRQIDKGAYEARFWVDVLNGEQPVVRIVKRYVLAPQSYSIDMSLRFESLSGQEVQLVVDQGGPIGIPSEDPRTDFRKVFVVNTEKDRPVPTRWTHAQLVKKGPTVVGSANPVAWIALADKYFTAITAPVKATGAPAAIADVRIFTETQDTKDPKAGGDIETDMVSPPVVAQPHQAGSLEYDLYVGPKDPHIFTENPQYAARSYNLMNSAEYAWCTFSSLGELMTTLLHWLNRWIWPHNYGVAIIILVLLVRLIMHPLTKHQQITMTQMQQRQAEVAPKVEALKQRYANDRAQLQAETMRVYREAGINPASQMAGCLPMVIQLPIWVALYSALNYDINLRHAPFILWIKDLSAPDAFLHWKDAVNIPLISWFVGNVDKLNILPVFLAVAMYLQQKFTPKPKPAPGTSPEQLAQQQQMQKMMGFMMIFMGLLFYNMPSGLCLYIMASSAFGILEQYRIRKHIEERKNQPQVAKPARRIAWLDKVMEKMEKKARESQTIRKEK